MAKTKIEWADEVWNPVTGCSKVSQGCKNCYAERIYERFHPGQKFTDVHIISGRLNDPLHWKKPRRVFVNSMSDLFHEAVPDEFIWKVFDVISHNRRHTYMILTKRPERKLRWFDAHQERFWHYPKPGKDMQYVSAPWPDPCIWLGVSCEDQKAADERIPLLLQTPAAVRFVSVEPMLGPVNLHLEWFYSNKDLHWVICGGESGPHARPMHPDWARSLRDQCEAAKVPFFFKQWGEWLPVAPQYPEGDSEPNLDDLDMMAHQICFGNRGTLYQEEQGLKQIYWCGYQPDPYQNPWYFEKVGKKAAGRVLDGITWDEIPERS